MPVNFETVKTMSAEDQRQILVDMEAENAKAHAELEALPDFKRYTDVLADPTAVIRNTNILDLAIGELSRYTAGFWQYCAVQTAEIRSLKFYLYMHSPHAEIKDEMRAVVDAFIKENFDEKHLIGRPPQAAGEQDTRIPEDVYYQGLLYLSTFGGEKVLGRNDVSSGLAFEFNVSTKLGYRPAVKPDVMENLSNKGMFTFWLIEATGSNLTFIGQAVLARLNEKYGESRLAQTYVKPVVRERLALRG